MKTQPHHRGPECPRCLRPTPTDAAWKELAGGEGEGLCWDEGAGMCEDRRSEEIARLRAKVADLERTATCAEEMRDASDAKFERLKTILRERGAGAGTHPCIGCGTFFGSVEHREGCVVAAALGEGGS